MRHASKRWGGGRGERFDTPESLLVAPQLPRERKKALLEEWARELAGEATRPSYGGTAQRARSAELLRRVRSAIELLEWRVGARRSARAGIEGELHGACSGRR